MSTPFDLTGKTALITGASRGIGRAIALAFAHAGADVVLTSRRSEGLEPVAHEIQELGRKAVVAPAHVGRPETVAAMVDCLVADEVPVDILINNAATNPAMGTLIETDPLAWQKILDVNVTGPLTMTRAVVPLMRRRKGGCIVNVASVAGIEPTPMLGAYSISKAALIHMTRVLAGELADDNIRVNAVAPGLVETKFSKALFDNKTLYKQFVGTTPMRRHAQPEEIAPAVLMFASEASSYITGQVLVIDGGGRM